MKFKRRHSEFEQGCELSESYTATDTLPPIIPACHQPLLLACMFITRDNVTDLFMMRGVCEPKFHCTAGKRKQTALIIPHKLYTV
jgi:hypothetical protein